MIDLTTRTHIDKPADVVYDFVVMHYMQNHARWDFRVVSSELTSGGGLEVGATGKEVRKQQGKESTYNFRVAELTSDHITFDATGPKTTFGSIWSVTPAGAGSDLTITFHLSLRGLGGLFEPMIKGGVRKEMVRAGGRIKRFVEER